MAQALVRGRIGTQNIDYSTDWAYTVNDTVTHINGYIGTKTAVVVPAKIEQRPTQLVSNFLHLDSNIARSIRSVTIPNTVRFVNNNASYAFQGCSNLYSVFIPKGTTNLSGAFRGSAVGCVNFYNYSENIVNVRIPNSVTNMSGAFCEGGKYSSESAIRCDCFENKTDFIPNSVTDVSFMFDSAEFSGYLPNIPQSVTNMSWFAGSVYGSYEPASLPKKIGSNVKDMSYAFYWFTGYADGLVNIPSSVTNLASCFYSTTLMGNYSIQGHLPYATDVSWAFGNMQKDYYADTRVELSLTNSNLKSLNYLFGSDGYQIPGPNYINIYAPYATEMIGTFTGLYGNWKIASIPSNIVNMSYAFSDSGFEGMNYTAPYIPSKVINMAGAFAYCYGLERASFGTNVQDISSCYQECYGLNYIPNIPNKVINMAYTFYGCEDYRGDIVITSPNVINMTACFGATYLPKAVYVPSYSDTWYTALNAIDGKNGVTVYPLEDLDSSSFNSQFEYYETEDEVIITNYIGGSSEVSVPSKFNYKNVVLGPSRYINYYEYDYYTEQISGPFVNKKNIITVRMSPNVKVMGGDMSYMFYNCTNLTSVPILPKNAVNGAYAFYNCQKLSIVGNNIEEITNGAYMFWHCAGIGGNFYLSPKMRNCSNMFGYAGGGITNLYIPNGITNISYLAYAGKMTCNINIPGSITEASYAFHSCPINKINITNGVTNLYYTFANCQSLVNAPTIPNSVVNLAYTFANCQGLINAPTIPNSVVNLYYTFSNCHSLVNGPTSIGNNVTTMIGTFLNCTKLTNVCNIPNSVTSCNSIFHNCTSLNSRINFGTGVQYMTYAFRYATAFANSVYIYSKNVTNCYNMFYNTSIAKTVYVYSGSTTNTTIRNTYMYTNGRNGVTVSYI